MTASIPTAPADFAEAVAAVYRVLLGREPEEAGLAYHVGLLEQSHDLMAVVGTLTQSPEFAARMSALISDPAPGPAPAPAELDEPITIVDIGAQRLSDQSHAYAPLDAAGYRTRVIGFEPLAERLEDRKTAEADGALEMLPYFIGDGSRRTFYMNNYDATSSLLPLNERLTSQFVELAYLDTVRTEDAYTRKLDDVLPAHQRIDFLKLDIQGFELEALKGAEAALARTLVVHCEASFAEIYKDQCFFSDVEIFLRARGFAFIDIVHAHRAGYVVPSGTVRGDRLLWADAVFFKEPEGLAPSERAIQAVIAQLIYGKHALAEKLISFA